MESTVVVKVKFGETLRRFNALVNEAGQLDLDIGGLRDKVISLFSFAPDTDLTLTYVDEDGDVVTLVDEEDLWDVMRQSLNPLRITVKLNAEKGSRFYARSSGNSTPMRSPRVQHPLHNLNNSLSDILKSVPQSFREPLSKLSLDLASKAASSSPTFFELLDSVSKIGQCNIHPVSVFQDGTESSTQSQASGSMMAASMTKEPEGDDGATLEVMPNANVGEPTFRNIPKVDLVNSSGVVDASVTPAARSLNLNAELPGDFLPSGSVSANLPRVAPHDAVGDSKEATKSGDSHLSGKACNSTWKNIKEVASSVFASDNDKEVKKSGVEWNSINLGASSSTADATKYSIMNSNTTASVGIASTKFPTLQPVNDCPFVGLPVANDSAVPYTHYGACVHPFKRSYNHNDDMGSIFHKGVRCDGCGVHPITGPRFKSKVKEDYDLCIVCFSEMGNMVDYIRMDRPVSHRNPYSSKGLYVPNPRVRTLPHVRDCGMKPNQPKLDSRFVMDVNIPDGTIMAPSTPFTKIWRMRNNGTIVWPRGTQLVWIGGDRLSAELSVEFQVDDGFTMENELDIAVDFTAPALPGRYSSYWRMASPSGQKFGQRVWVLIQVDASVKDYLCNSFQGLNLNLPPEGSGNAENTNVNVEPMAVEASLPMPDNSDRDSELVEPPSADTGPNKDQELNFPINDNLLVGGGGVSNTLPPKSAASDSYPTIPITDSCNIAASAGTSHVPSPSIVVPASVWGGGNENSNVEQSLLRELEEMGFKQVDLNKEILRMNKYDLEQSVDDLCGVAEWDPILEELQEMGFSDKEMNKRLLKKNNGSIKRVVMDLITGENA